MCACAHFICLLPFGFQGAKIEGLHLGAPYVCTIVMFMSIGVFHLEKSILTLSFM
jgi:hypothetical protein